MNYRRSLSVSRASLFAAFFLTCVGRAYAALPSDSQSDPQSTMEVQVKNDTLKIPKGYFDGFFGYKDKIYLRALLPCLLPKSDDNPEHNNTLGDAVRIEVMDGKSFPSDEKLFDIYTKNTPPSDVKREKDSVNRIFHIYERHSDEVFLKNYDTDERFFFVCDKSPEDAPWLHMPFPHCEVRERIWGDVLLAYRFERRFLPQAIEIDKKVRSLLDGFRDTKSSQKEISSNGVCKRI